ncbi:MAG: hypothetical protein NVSMB6_26240 [Burkholderiaceae bacterium]
MNKWHQLVRVAIAVALVSLMGQSAPTKGSAQPTFFMLRPDSVQLSVQAQPFAVFADQNTIDASRTPASPFAARGVGVRSKPDHELVPEAIFRQLKAAASHNPYAPLDLFARPFSNDTRGPLTPAPIVKFAGLTNLDGVEPPDMALAVSPNWVAQGVNDHFTVLSRTGVRQAGWPKGIATFFHVPSPGSCDPSPFMSDPRAFYIIQDQRFVLAALQIDGPLIGTSCAPLSKYWIAISKTNNPNGAWNVYAFDMRGGTQNVADFTQLGYDANGIYFSGNMFSSSAGSYQYAQICGAPKAKMEAGLTATAHCFSKLKAGGITVDTVQPVISLTQPPTITAVPVEFFINSKNILNCSAVCNGVTVWAFSNVLSSTPSLTAASIATTSYSLPPNGAEPGGFINTDDQRISGTPVYQGGLISFGLNTAVKHGTNTVSGILWGQIKPTLTGSAITGGTVFQSGIVSFTGSQSAYYPALVPDSRGDLFMGFGSSSNTLNPSAYYVGRKLTDVHGTFGTAVQLFHGPGAYVFGRWGDYSAVAIEGNTAASEAWMSLEYATAGGDWATEIGATRFP